MEIIVAGDFAPRYRIAEQIESGNYSCLKTINEQIKKADYSIVNLEAPVVMHNSKPIEKHGPRLKCTERAIDCLVDNGFRCVTLANNHFRDYGQDGVNDTIEVCMDKGLDYVGGGRDIKEAEKILYKTFNDKKLAIINVCEEEWSIADENHGGSVHLDPINTYYAIIKAKKKADYVIVIVHGGNEMFQLPSLRMVKTYRFLIDAGADAVVNHHQHCYSGYEIYNNHPIFYGLGNFCFDTLNERKGIWTEGYCVSLSLENKIVNFKLIPYIQCASVPGVELLPENAFDERINELNAIIANTESLKKALADYYKESASNYGDIFEPYRNRYLYAAKHRGWFPSLISKHRGYMISNYILCESHRDKLLWWIKNNLK